MTPRHSKVRKTFPWLPAKWNPGSQDALANSIPLIWKYVTFKCSTASYSTQPGPAPGNQSITFQLELSGYNLFRVCMLSKELELFLPFFSSISFSTLSLLTFSYASSSLLIRRWSNYTSNHAKLRLYYKTVKIVHAFGIERDVENSSCTTLSCW